MIDIIHIFKSIAQKSMFSNYLCKLQVHSCAANRLLYLKVFKDHII